MSGNRMVDNFQHGDGQAGRDKPIKLSQLFSILQLTSGQYFQVRLRRRKHQLFLDQV